jgi:hypothetical protein
MLGHLVSNGYAGSPDAQPRRESVRPSGGKRAHHPGWIERLFTQIFHRR